MISLTRSEKYLVAASRRQNVNHMRLWSVPLGILCIALACFDYAFSFVRQQPVDITRFMFLMVLGGTFLERPKIVSTISKLSARPELEDELSGFNFSVRRRVNMVLLLLSVVAFVALTHLAKAWFSGG